MEKALVNEKTLMKPISLALLRKHCLQHISPYFRMSPCGLPQTRLQITKYIKPKKKKKHSNKQTQQTTATFQNHDSAMISEQRWWKIFIKFWSKFLKNLEELRNHHFSIWSNANANQLNVGLQQSKHGLAAEKGEFFSQIQSQEKDSNRLLLHRNQNTKNLNQMNNLGINFNVVIQNNAVIKQFEI